MPTNRASTVAMPATMPTISPTLSLVPPPLLPEDGALVVGADAVTPELDAGVGASVLDPDTGESLRGEDDVVSVLGAVGGVAVLTAPLPFEGGLVGVSLHGQRCCVIDWSRGRKLWPRLMLLLL